ncbi:MAG: hypothetical protein AABO58_17240 [Acidobacteriota bacterium]
MWFYGLASRSPAFPSGHDPLCSNAPLNHSFEFSLIVDPASDDLLHSKHDVDGVVILEPFRALDRLAEHAQELALRPLSCSRVHISEGNTAFFCLALPTIGPQDIRTRSCANRLTGWYSYARIAVW